MDPTVRVKLAQQIVLNPLFALLEEETEREYYIRWTVATDPETREAVWQEREAFMRFISSFKSTAGEPLETEEAP